MKIFSPVRKSIISASVLAALPKKGVSGKWYRVDDSVYLWSDIDQDYFEVGAGSGGGVSLGETSTTAYRGDRGKTAYDHSQITGNPHGTTAADVGADASGSAASAESAANSYTDSQIAALTADGESYAILLADGAVNNLTNTWVDVQVSGGGAVLRIAVTSGKMYYFEAEGCYSASSTAVGSKWGIDGPAATYLAYESDYSLSTTSMTYNQGLSAFQLPANTNGTSAATAGNRFSISGFYMPSADGYLKIIFGCETNLGSITPKAGCFIRTKILY